MTLYEINNAIERCVDAVDPETGELLCDDEMLDKLMVDRAEKVGNICYVIKNLKAENEMLKGEVDRLNIRIRQNQRKKEWLEQYVSGSIPADGFKYLTVKASFRRSSAVEVTEGFVDWCKRHRHKDLLRIKPAPDPEPDKKAIKAALESGKDLGGMAAIVTHESLVVS